MTVTLHPRHQLDLHDLYRITIIGTGPTGLTDPTGNLLDGSGTGQSGSNYIGVLKASELVLGAFVPGGPAQLAKLRRELAQIVAYQAKEQQIAKRKSAKQSHVSIKTKIVHSATITAARKSSKPKVSSHGQNQTGLKSRVSK
jgi:hypothetical protein